MGVPTPTPAEGDVPAGLPAGAKRVDPKDLDPEMAAKLGLKQASK